MTQTIYFHGGVPGLTPGCMILPPDVTKVRSCSEYGAAGRCEAEQECSHDPWCRINGQCLRSIAPETPVAMHDDYKPLDTPQGVTLERCPCCGSESALWQYSESESAPRQLAVMCTHGEAIGPQDGIRNEGCLLYMPPEQFYRETIRDAIRYWNEFAKALIAMRARDGGSHA